MSDPLTPMLILFGVFPAMAWGIVFDPVYPKMVNLLTFVIFCGPFLFGIIRSVVGW